jgi:hypothetical protein
MKNYLCDDLTENPKLYLEKMVEMLLEKLDVKISLSTVGSRKKMRRITKQRVHDLRDYYFYKLGELNINLF